jgi:flagellar motor component MotA
VKQYNAEFAKILGSISEDQKKECNTLIDSMCGMADQARMNGLLALEERLEEDLPVFLWSGIRMITDGTEWKTIERTLLNLLHAGQLNNLQFVKQFIMIEGLRGIYDGDNPSVLKVILSSFLGEEEVKKALEN